MTIVFRCGTSFKIFSCNITAFSQYKNSSWKPWIDTQLCYYDRTPLITVLLHWRAILYKYSLLLLLLTPYKPLGEQGMAQWWQRWPPTNVAQVQIPASTPYVGWVCSLLCSKRFFFEYSSFLLSSKTNTSKFQFDQESGRQRTTLWMCYLQIIIYFIYFYLFINL